MQLVLLFTLFLGLLSVVKSFSQNQYVVSTSKLMAESVHDIMSDPMFLDEKESKAKAKANFPLTDEAMIATTKEFLYHNTGIAKPSLLANDFKFRGPVVGPLAKEAYLKAVGGFDIKEAFPDLNPRFHDFRVCCQFGNRVWFTSQATGTFLGPFGGGIIKPNGKTFSTPPQCCSTTFNEAGEITKFTIGHIMGERICERAKLLPSAKRQRKAKRSGEGGFWGSPRHKSSDQNTTKHNATQRNTTQQILHSTTNRDIRRCRGGKHRRVGRGVRTPVCGGPRVALSGSPSLLPEHSVPTLQFLWLPCSEVYLKKIVNFHSIY